LEEVPVAKILVADDNSNIQKMVGLALKDQGIDVVAVGNGEAAVRKISDVKPDLVLADVFMPVRNGYEVCRYVKEDSALSHIPVILLVGAFDPLDEQEAQRVGADGVLKKPFVPPDPLISMVKSALTRAGIPVGNEPAPAEKAPEPLAAPAAKDLLNAGVSSKLAALSSPPPIPEAEAEPIDEFPAPPPAVKIAAGSEPVAFGSLLETPEDDMAFVSKPIEELEQARNWGSGAETEEEEEDEEKPGRGGWRPGGLDEVAEPAMPANRGPAKDWREEAFHGNSPANISSGRGWSPSPATTQVAEVAEAPAVTTATMESKPIEAATPFAGDAWAAALASTVEDKIVGTAETVVAANESTTTTEVAQTSAVVEELKAAEVAPAQVSEPANWAAPSESPWEKEAKKASLLAATWDAPATSPETPNVTEAEKFLAATEVLEEPTAAVAEPSGVAASSVEEAVAAVPEAPAADIAEPVKAEEPAPMVSEEHGAAEGSAGSMYTSEAPLDVNATQEVSAFDETGTESAYSAAPLEEIAKAPEVAKSASPVAETKPNAQAADMDALVARVLAKMNPEVLQKVTQEILKPVIEAIIKDELDEKK
jgi:CheY-like chemotaxis protein